MTKRKSFSFLVFWILAATPLFGEDVCQKGRSPTPDQLWAELSTSSIRTCINKHAEALQKVMELGAGKIEAEKTKQQSIIAWIALVNVLDGDRAKLSGSARVLNDEVYWRAELALKAVSSKPYGKAGPLANRSSWEIDFDGHLPVIPELSMDKIDIEAGLIRVCQAEGAECPIAYEVGSRLLQRIALASSIGAFYGKLVITGLAAKVAEIDANWDRFLFDSKPMYPLDLTLTDLWNRQPSQYNKQLGLRKPPSTQYFLLHPAPGVGYVGGAPDGAQLKAAIYVELLGINWWDLKRPFGVSAIVEYADREDMEDVGYGVLFTYANKFSLGVTGHDGDVGLVVGLDLAHFYAKRLQPKIERMRLDLPDLAVVLEPPSDPEAEAEENEPQ